MEIEMTTPQLRALGDQTRLRIVECLACCPECINGSEDGHTATRVCCDVTGGEKITSTVSHHLKELREAGLIRMERQGKKMICSLEREALKKLGGYLISIASGEKNVCC